MPNFHIGRHGASVINFLTDHLGGFFDGVKELLNFLLRTVYDVLSALPPVGTVIVLAVIVPDQPL